MSDALTPLRRAYGMEAPQQLAGVEPAPGETGHVELDVIAQGKALLETMPKHSASPQCMERVLAEASRVQTLALDGTRVVRAVYDEDTHVSSELPAVETAVLKQGRELVEGWSNAMRDAPVASVLEAVLSQAEAASTRGRPKEELVIRQDLLPLASAYGLPSGGSNAAIAGSAEGRLLLETRRMLDRMPRSVPSDSVLSAILLRSGRNSAPPRQTTVARSARPAADRPASTPAVRRRRGGILAGLTSAAGALVLALVLWPSGASDSVQGEPTALTNADSVSESGVETPALELSGAGANLELADATPLGAATSGAATSGAAAPPSRARASAPLGPPPVAERQGRRPSAMPVAQFGGNSPTRSARSQSAVPPAASSAELRREADFADVAEAAPRTPAPASAVPAWDMPSDHRVLSLRLNEIKRANQGTNWDASAEAFGAPKAPGLGLPSQGIQVVREGAAPARARVIRDSIPRNNR